MKNDEEARAILEAKVAEFCRRPFVQLRAKVGAEPETGELAGQSGTMYQFEIEAVWDSKPGGTVRVIGCIDDGGLSAFAPLTSNELVSPD